MKEFFFRDLQNFLGSACGDRFVTWVLRTCGTRGRIVLSESQAVLVLVGLVLSGPHNCSSRSTKSCSTCMLSLVWMVQFGQGYLIGFPKTVPGVSRVRVPAVFPVDGRALCGRGVRTLLGCRSLIVLYALRVNDRQFFVLMI